MGQRYPELDAARGLAVAFMVMVHALMLYADPAASASLPGLVIGYLGTIPSAPVFMLLMGAGIAFSRDSSRKKLLMRGGTIFAAGYLLNFLRGTLPAFLGWLILQDASLLLYVREAFFYVDILQFAGLALIVLGLIGKRRERPLFLVLTALACGAAATILAPLQVETSLSGAFLSLFIGANESLSKFPFLTWFIYPLAGVLFGQALRQSRERERFYRRLIPVAAVLFATANIGIAAAAFLQGKPYVFFAEPYYFHGFLHSLSYTALVLLWISALHPIVRKTPERILRPLARWSRNVFEIYFLQWILLSWLVAVLGQNQLGVAETLLAAAAVLGLSDALAVAYRSRRLARRRKVLERTLEEQDRG